MVKELKKAALILEYLSKITLVEKGEIVTDDKEIAESFSKFFVNAVRPNSTCCNNPYASHALLPSASSQMRWMTPASVDFSLQACYFISNIFVFRNTKNVYFWPIRWLRSIGKTPKAVQKIIIRMFEHVRCVHLNIVRMVNKRFSIRMWFIRRNYLIERWISEHISN